MIRKETKAEAAVIRNPLAPGQPIVMPIAPVYAEYLRDEIAKLERGTNHQAPFIPAARGRPSSGKVVVSIRLDPAVIAKFKATGDGWQSRINDVLMAAKV